MQLLPGESEKFDVASRTVPLDSIANILSLEYTVPKKMMLDNNDMSRTAPAGGSAVNLAKTGVADDRLSGAAQRQNRTTKRDVEEMHNLLQQRKREQMAAAAHARAAAAAAERAADAAAGAAAGESPDNARSQSLAAEAAAASAAAAALTSPLKKVPKGRPASPNLTLNRSTHISVEQGSNAPAAASTTEYPQAGDMTLSGDLDFQAAVVLLQRLLRGRAVQNMMFEGKYRRRELIHELKTADEELAAYEEQSALALDAEWRAQREQQLRESTADNMAGVAASNLLVGMSQEQARMANINAMLGDATGALVDRRTVEAAEAGRRQRDKMEYPVAEEKDHKVASPAMAELDDELGVEEQHAGDVGGDADAGGPTSEE
jgi:hypothetical protein